MANKHEAERILTKINYCGGLIPCKCSVEYFTTNKVIVDLNKVNKKMSEDIVGIKNELEYKRSALESMIKKEADVKNMSWFEFRKWKRA